MSDYTKATNFAVKDGYSTGNPSKVVKGTEIDNEFNAIANAVASKADIASPTFTGTPAAPTASSGTNTTQLATTAFVTGAVSDSLTASATLTNKTLTSPTINGGTITGITDLAVADGGTGASTASGARANLGLGTLATLSTITDSEITNSTITPSKLAQPLTRGTAQNSTSGTSIDFTSIPSWVKRITVMFNAVSTSGTSNVQVRLGDSGGIEATGYTGIVSEVQVGGGVNATTWTGTGAEVTRATPAASAFNGQVVISLISGNIWVFAGVVGYPSSNYQSTGNKTLSDTLTQIRITTVNGTDTFDAGSINILYE